jgi:hypothetical protein
VPQSLDCGARIIILLASMTNPKQSKGLGDHCQFEQHQSGGFNNRSNSGRCFLPAGLSIKNKTNEL